MIEAGMPDFDTSIWFGLMAPAGTPREVIDKLAGRSREAVKSTEVVEGLAAAGHRSVGGGPTISRAMIASELKRWGEVAAAAGLKK